MHHTTPTNRVPLPRVQQQANHPDLFYCVQPPALPLFDLSTLAGTGLIALSAWARVFRPPSPSPGTA